MSSKSQLRTYMALCLAVALLSNYSMVALANNEHDSKNLLGELTTFGDVAVDGEQATSGVSLFSGSTVASGQESSALIGLGELGLLRLSPNSALRLDFTETGITGRLDAGHVRLSIPRGSPVSIITNHGSAISDPSQAALFTVNVEGGETVVSTEMGRVEFRAADGIRQITAGQAGSAGSGNTGNSLSGRGLTGLLLAIGGAVATIIIIVAATDDDEDDIPTPPNPSPVR